MENIILNDYFNHLNKNKKRKCCLKKIYTLPKPLLFMILILIINVGFSLYFNLHTKNQMHLLISLSIQMAMIIFITVSTEHYDRINSKNKFAENLDNVNLAYEFLESISITSKKHVVELKSRIDEIKEKSEIYLKESNTALRHWIQIIFVPIFLLLVSKIIQDGTEAIVIVNQLIVIIFFTVIFLSVIVGVHKIINFYMSNYIYRLNIFSNALQGVLDTHFDGGLLYSYNQGRKNKKIIPHHS